MRKVIVTAAMIAIAVVIVAAASCGGGGRSAPVGVNLSGNATPPTATQTLPGDSATPVAGIPQEAPKSAPTVVGDDGKVSPPPPSPDNPPDDQEPTDESDSEPGVLAPGTEVPVANDVGTTGTAHPTVSPLTPAGSESGSQSAQEPPEWQSIWQAPDTLNRYLIVEGFARVRFLHSAVSTWNWNTQGYKNQYGYELLGFWEDIAADPPYYDADIKLPPEMTFAEAYELLPEQLTGVMSVRPWIVEKLESSQVGSSQMPSWGDALNSADGGDWRAGLPYKWNYLWYWYWDADKSMVPWGWAPVGSIIIIQFQGEDWWPAPSHERVDVNYWTARVRELGDVIPDLERRGFVHIFPMVGGQFGMAQMVMPPGWTLPEAQYRLPKEYYPWIKWVHSGA